MLAPLSLPLWHPHRFHIQLVRHGQARVSELALQPDHIAAVDKVLCGSGTRREVLMKTRLQE